MHCQVLQQRLSSGRFGMQFNAGRGVDGQQRCFSLQEVQPGLNGSETITRHVSGEQRGQALPQALELIQMLGADPRCIKANRLVELCNPGLNNPAHRLFAAAKFGRDGFDRAANLPQRKDAHIALSTG